MKRDSDCSSSSSGRKPSSSETASLACRILPSRSDTKTGSGALAMMISASSEPRASLLSALLAFVGSLSVLTIGQTFHQAVHPCSSRRGTELSRLYRILHLPYQRRGSPQAHQRA